MTTPQNDPPLALPLSEGLGPTPRIDARQVLHALARQEKARLDQAEAMGMDYSAEFPAEDAERGVRPALWLRRLDMQKAKRMGHLVAAYPLDELSEGELVPVFDQSALDEAVAAEREHWRRIGEAAQAVTVGCTDTGDEFILPSHLMASLALALDEGPNV